jgi:hypothetical protein
LHIARGGVDVAIQVELQGDVEVAKLAGGTIWLTLAMRLNWRSSGVATALAMVSGLAPGKFA